VGTDRRTEILEATCRVIGRSGVHDLRVEDVAKEVGVSPALVYYYFDTRADLLNRAFEYADARSTSHSVKQMDMESSGRQQLKDILFHEYDDAPEVRENWVIWSEMEANAVFDQELLEAIVKRSAHWVKIVTDLIRVGESDGSIAPGAVPDNVAERLIGVSDSLGMKWMRGLMTQERALDLMAEAIDIELGSQP
jgi:AcrR family transcriptional regulator